MSSGERRFVLLRAIFLCPTALSHVAKCVSKRFSPALSTSFFCNRNCIRNSSFTLPMFCYSGSFLPRKLTVFSILSLLRYPTQKTFYPLELISPLRFSQLLAVFCLSLIFCSLYWYFSFLTCLLVFRECMPNSALTAALLEGGEESRV